MVPPHHYSSHLDIEDDDPNVGAKFSIEQLRKSQEGLHTIPSTVHGAPISAQVRVRHTFYRRLQAQLAEYA